MTSYSLQQSWPKHVKGRVIDSGVRIEGLQVVRFYLLRTEYDSYGGTEDIYKNFKSVNLPFR